MRIVQHHRRRRAALTLLAVLGFAGGCSRLGPPGADLAPDPVVGHYPFQQPHERWPLPDELEEASGLAWIGGGLVSHQDDDARLWRLQGIPGQAPRPAPLPGQAWPPADGDFEGVAVRDGYLHLLGSQGTLLRGTLDPAGVGLLEHLAPVATGIEGRCNFEGVAPAPAAGRLYVACKYPRAPRPGEILLFEITPGDGAPRALRVDVTPVLAVTGLSRLRPSGLEWLPQAERLLVLAGKEHLLLELDGAGRLLAWRRLPRRFHRQAEGIAMMPDGGIAIVDEADGRRATLSVYRRVQRADERL